MGRLYLRKGRHKPTMFCDWHLARVDVDRNPGLLVALPR